MYPGMSASEQAGRDRAMSFGHLLLVAGGLGMVARVSSRQPWQRYFRLANGKGTQKDA